MKTVVVKACCLICRNCVDYHPNEAVSGWKCIKTGEFMVTQVTNPEMPCKGRFFELKEELKPPRGD